MANCFGFRLLPMVQDTERFHERYWQEDASSCFILALTGSIVLDLFTVSSLARINDA